MKIGILTFHRCINYGSYWQALCLAEAMQNRGHTVEILDHCSNKVNLAEWKCAMQPVLPVFVPPSDIPLYRKKIGSFFAAFEDLPLSKTFPLASPEQMDMYDLVIVGSDEVWNLSHPWYGYYPIFYGDGIQAKQVIAYAASFGNYDASAGLEKEWAEKLRQLERISVRDENSQRIIKNALGLDVPQVLDPCFLFPVNPAPIKLPFSQPYLAVYGHNFSEKFIANIKEFARSRCLPLISIGYRNDWADEQWLTAGPLEFAAFVRSAKAVATNFFHGCVFALINTKPFVCETSPYRSLKVQDLMDTIHAQSHLMSEQTPFATYNEKLAEPLSKDILRNIETLRVFSFEWLDNALSYNPSIRHEFV